MNMNSSLLGSLLGCVLTAVSIGSEPTGYSLPWIAGPLDNLPYVVRGDIQLQDGVLVLAPGGASLRSHGQLDDFELDLQWCCSAEDSGGGSIVVGAQADGHEAAETSGYAIDLAVGSAGRLVHEEELRPGMTVQAGQWNGLRLKVAGNSAELLVNGQSCWKIDDLPRRTGWLEFRSSPEASGHLSLREIRIVEANHRSLFNGTDLSCWEGAGSGASECWDVRDGMLFCTGKRGPWLRSMEEFDDFNLRLEYKLRPGGNSGVYVRVPANGNHHGEGAGIEVQILDDGAERYKSLKPYQYCGSLYAIVAAEPRVSRPAGAWNTLEIDCRQTAYRVVHNGIEVVNATAEQASELARRRVSGYLGLQNHSEEVDFRHLRIGPSMLPPSD
jgi:hypothetical protein